MYTLFVVLHVMVSLFLIMVVLLQTGKGASMGAAFGGGSSTMFGARGQTTFIHKLTAAMALVFMVLSVALASLSAGNLSDLEEDEVPPPGKEAGMMAEPETEGEGEAVPEEGKPKPIKIEKVEKPKDTAKPKVEVKKVAPPKPPAKKEAAQPAKP
jgi:preprotein translocase subunit SecG